VDGQRRAAAAADGGVTDAAAIRCVRQQLEEAVELPVFFDQEGDGGGAVPSIRLRASPSINPMFQPSWR
jgi:hypothetical protein